MFQQQHALAAPRRVFSFMDDQGYDADLYFTDAEDRTFKVVVPKSFDVGVQPTKTTKGKENA